jgi:hypothetical protein
MSNSISIPDNGFITLQNLWQASSLKEASREAVKWTSYGAIATGTILASEWIVSQPLSLQAATPIMVSSALVGVSIPLAKWSLGKMQEISRNIFSVPSKASLPLALAVATVGLKASMPLLRCVGNNNCLHHAEWDWINSGTTVLTAGIVYPMIGAHLKDVFEIITQNTLFGKKLKKL